MSKRVVEVEVALNVSHRSILIPAALILIVSFVFGCLALTAAIEIPCAFGPNDHITLNGTTYSLQLTGDDRWACPDGVYQRAVSVYQSLP